MMCVIWKFILFLQVQIYRGGGGGWVPVQDLQFVAQIFHIATTTLLHNVGKNLARPPPLQKSWIRTWVGIHYIT